MSFINYMTHRGRTYPTGIRGQCVEFARRWFIAYHDILFENVEHAINIWDIPSVTRLSDEQVLSFLSIPNNGQSLPPVGSLLIYRQTNEMPHGHVAVVVGVDTKKKIVSIDDRNRRGHSKTISIHKNGQLDDPTILGWKVARI